jgi:hypothetical protein
MPKWTFSILQNAKVFCHKFIIVDYAKEHEGHMNFDVEKEKKKIINWNSVSKMIFSEENKTFQMTVEKLSKIKALRLEQGKLKPKVNLFVVDF